MSSLRESGYWTIYIVNVFSWRYSLFGLFTDQKVLSLYKKWHCLFCTVKQYNCFDYVYFVYVICKKKTEIIKILWTSTSFAWITKLNIHKSNGQLIHKHIIRPCQTDILAFSHVYSFTNSRIWTKNMSSWCILSVSIRITTIVSYIFVYVLCCVYC